MVWGFVMVLGLWLCVCYFILFIKCICQQRPTWTQIHVIRERVGGQGPISRMPTGRLRTLGIKPSRFPLGVLSWQTLCLSFCHFCLDITHFQRSTGSLKWKKMFEMQALAPYSLWRDEVYYTLPYKPCLFSVLIIIELGNIEHLNRACIITITHNHMYFPFMWLYDHPLLKVAHSWVSWQHSWMFSRVKSTFCQ